VTEEDTDVVTTTVPKQASIECVQVHNSNCSREKISDEENSHPPMKPVPVDSPSRSGNVNRAPVADSPLSLLPSEFGIVRDPRNRKPIYITQSQQEEAKSSKRF